MRKLSGLALIITGLLGGCAGDKGDLNQVQPGYVTKSELLGKTWYYRRTVVDSPEGLGAYATIGTGDLFVIERVRFEIQEDYLVAFRDYEHIPGSEEAEYEGNNAYKGGPVVAFPITSHFDIIYDFNARTGEKSNVRTEDSSLNPWYDREYMRVQWSVTGLNDEADLWLLPVDLLDTDGLPGAGEYVHENDVANPYRARITPSEGFFDFVTNHYVVPDIYTCYLDYDFQGDPFGCGPGELKIRHAFAAVDEEQNAGYKPLAFPDTVTLKDAAGNEITDEATGEVVREPVWERFGYYRLDKLTYDNERGLTESGRLYRIIRFNMWDKSVDASGSEIPYAQRQVRPINYWLNWDFPSELRQTAYEVAAEWNDAFKATAATLQGKNVAQIPDVFVLHDNTCSVAGVQNYWNSFAAGVNEELEAAVKADVDVPLDAANVDHYCAALEFHSRRIKAERAADDKAKNIDTPFTWEQIGDPRFNMMYYITQVIPSGFSGYGPMLGDPISGRNVVSSAYIMGWTIDSAAIRALEYIDYINGELELFDLLRGENLPNYFFTEEYDPQAMSGDINQVQKNAKTQASAAYLATMEQRFQVVEETLDGEMMTPIENSDHFMERLNRVAGTQLEREYLMRPEDLQLASRGTWTPGTPVSDELYESASPILRKQDVKRRREYTQRRMQERTMCPMADLDGALVGLAKRLKDLPRDERLLTLRQEIFRAVMLHEVGHNVGLRHNFEGSYDALNFNRAFWDLENAYGDDEDAKLEAAQPEFKYSSIMDYHGKINADFAGLGLYDKAAIKFGYGQIIESFKDGSTGGKTLKTWRKANDYRDLIFEDADGLGVQGEPYFSSVGAMYDREDVIFDWTKKDLTQAEVQALTASEVPYMFCSDEYAQYTPTCKRFDFGANQREVQESWKTNYKNYFIFSNFLRNRLVLDLDRVMTRGLNAFGDTMLTYKYFYLYRAKDPNFLNTDLGADMAQSVANGLNLMTEIISMPQPNNYYRCVADAGQPTEEVIYYSYNNLEYDAAVDGTVGKGRNGEACDMGDRISLGLGDTLPMFFGFSEEWYNWTFTYLGTYWDKDNALSEMTYPAATYFRENQEEDMRTYSVSLYRLYEPELDDILLGLVNYDPKHLGSGLIDTGDVALVPRAMVDLGIAGAPVASARIEAGLVRNMQLYALLYGMAFLSSPLDSSLDFAKRTRVVVEGAADDFVDAANVAALATCTLPESGITFKAPANAATVSDWDISYNFVTQCATRVTEREAMLTALTAAKTTLAGLDEETEAYDDQVLVVEKAQEVYDTADVKLRETEQALQFLRELGKTYEYGIGL